MIIALILLVGFFVFYLVSPFFEKRFRKRRLEGGSDQRQNLLFQKEEILDAIQDLEYDFKMRKTTEADYLRVKEDLTQQAIEIMKKLDSLERNPPPRVFEPLH